MGTIATPRRDGWTACRRRQFLEDLMAGVNVRQAAARAGLSREGAYRLRRRDAQFAAQWDEALRNRREKAELAFLEHLPAELRERLAAVSPPGDPLRPGVSSQDSVPCVPGV